MRIRSIRPEFWRSKSISMHSIEDRLLFIGLWSYVDDNGVGIDRLSLIAADLFADDLEKDPRETFARVSRGLASLSEAGRITRYHVDGDPFLSITNWAEHQRIDKPGKQRYPAPTTPNAVIRETVATPSRDSRDTLAPGEGEKGRRGEELFAHPEDAQPEPDRFAEFWMAYPKKVSKKRAQERWKTAIKKTNPQVILDGLHRYVTFLNLPDQWQQPKDPDGWLSQERWNDQLDGIQAAGNGDEPVRKPRPGEMGYITPEMPEHIRAQFDNPRGAR